MKPRRILILHSNVAPDAPPDELDTLVQAASVGEALKQRGHEVLSAPFVDDESALVGLVLSHKADAIFNLVESIDGSGVRSARAPQIFDRLGLVYTGATGAQLELTCDKPRTKRRLREAGLPTPVWSEPPDWHGLDDGSLYIVKSALEDASLGLDDNSVVAGSMSVGARARFCAEKFGGQWFAETYVDGREFNVAMLEGEAGPRVLPLAEMTFQEWQTGRPRIVGYRAKWEEESFDATRTVRAFGIECAEPALARELTDLARRTWQMLGLSGYVRVDFRVDLKNRPTILEINPNPCLAPDAGFAAAAARSGLTYPVLVERIVEAALS